MYKGGKHKSQPKCADTGSKYVLKTSAEVQEENNHFSVILTLQVQGAFQRADTLLSFQQNLVDLMPVMLLEGTDRMVGAKKTFTTCLAIATFAALRNFVLGV